MAQVNKRVNEMTAMREAYDAEIEALRSDLRDRLAMAALTGILTHGTHYTHDKVMADAYRYADEGMKVRVVRREEPQAPVANVVVPGGVQR